MDDSQVTVGPKDFGDFQIAIGGRDGTAYLGADDSRQANALNTDSNFIKLQGQLLAARTQDASTGQDMYPVWLDVVEQPLIVGYQHCRPFGPAQGIDAVGHQPQRVDVETGIGLVQHAHLGFQHRHLQDLETLLLTLV